MNLDRRGFFKAAMAATGALLVSANRGISLIGEVFAAADAAKTSKKAAKAFYIGGKDAYALFAKDGAKDKILAYYTGDAKAAGKKKAKAFDKHMKGKKGKTPKYQKHLELAKKKGITEPPMCSNCSWVRYSGNGATKEYPYCASLKVIVDANGYCIKYIPKKA